MKAVPGARDGPAHITGPHGARLPDLKKSEVQELPKLLLGTYYLLLQLTSYYLLLLTTATCDSRLSTYDVLLTTYYFTTYDFTTYYVLTYYVLLTT